MNGAKSKRYRNVKVKNARIRTTAEAWPISAIRSIAKLQGWRSGLHESR
jgi:hypothetical protein